MVTCEGPTLPRLLKLNAEQCGTRVAIKHKRYGVWVPYSWQDYLSRVRAIAFGLRSIGIGEGDLVLLIGDNAPQWYFSELAVHVLRGISFGMYPEAAKAETLSLLKGMKVKCAIVEDVEQANILLEMRRDIPLERILYWRGRGIEGKDDPVLFPMKAVEMMGATRRQEDGTFEDLVGKGRPDDPCILVFTSGVTGPEKAVLHTHSSMLENVRRYLGREKWGPRERIMSLLPPFSVLEKWFCIGCHLLSASTLYVSQGPETFSRDMREARPTVVFFGAKVWERTVRNVEDRMAHSDALKRFVYRFFMERAVSVFRFLGGPLLFGPLKRHLGLSQARFCYNTGPLLASRVVEFYRRLKVPLKQLYWTTETGIICCSEGVEADSQWVGLPLEGVGVEVSEDREIRIRADHAFGCYLVEGKRKEVMKDGYFWPGDVGRNEKGGLVLIDRKGDAIKTGGGELLSCQSLESLIRTSIPYVEDAFVFKAEDEDVLCAILLMSGFGLRRWLQDRGLGEVDPTQVLKDMAFVQELKNAIGTVNGSGLPLKIERCALLLEGGAFLGPSRWLKKWQLGFAYKDLIDSLKQGSFKGNSLAEGLPVILLTEGKG